VSKWSLQDVKKRHANALTKRTHAIGMDLVEGIYGEVTATLPLASLVAMP